jgi:thiol-disulfide isomerase/thioredoxin
LVLVLGLLSGACATLAPSAVVPTVKVHFGVVGLEASNPEAVRALTESLRTLEQVEEVHFETSHGLFGLRARGSLTALMGPLVATVSQGGDGYHLFWGGPAQGGARLSEPSWRGNFSTLSGDAVLLEEVVGTTPAVITFWATWCGACIKESVYLQAFHESYGDSVRVLAININPPEDRARVEAFVAAGGLTYSVPLDPGGAFLETLGVEALPYTLVFNRAGELLYRENTFRESEVGMLEEAIERAAAPKER